LKFRYISPIYTDALSGRICTEFGTAAGIGVADKITIDIRFVDRLRSVDSAGQSTLKPFHLDKSSRR